MFKTITTVDIPKKPTERRAWVKYQLELRGLSLRAIGIREGVSQQAMSHALLAGGSSHLQEALAGSLGLTPQQLFPELYDDQGNRLGRIRPQYRSTQRRPSNVENEEAA